MAKQTIQLGTAANDGTGDPLRTAFTKINNNFSLVQNNVNLLTNSVTSVAGRTGNVVLTIYDVLGFQGLNLVSNAAPIRSNSSGTKGQVIVSSGNLYICTAANTWVRTAVTTSF